jgi:homoserine/homoserine lactone efflux protein
MPQETLFAFVRVMLVLMLIPGPNVMLVVATGMTHGLRASLLNAWGSTIALVPHMVALALALGPIMLFLGAWFDYIRWAGIALLLLFGVQQFLSRPLGQPGILGRQPFWLGFGVASLNFKRLLFLAAIVPHFLDPALPPTPQFVDLTVALVGVTLVTASAWAIVSSAAGRWFLGQPERERLRQRLGGAVTIGASLLLAVVEP